MRSGDLYVSAKKRLPESEEGFRLWEARGAVYVANDFARRISSALQTQLEKRVYIYRPGQPVEILDDPPTVSGDPVLLGFVLHVREVW
jgi:hypothetical protein